MRLSQASLFKCRTVYALPTWLGLGLFAIVATALFFSIHLRSPLEQWFSFLMIFFILLHLMDANDPFRDLSVELIPFDPPFAGRDFWIPIRITNPTDLASEPILFRFDDQNHWAHVPRLAGNASAQVQVRIYFAEKGKLVLPKLKLRTRPKSALFQLWKNIDLEHEVMVLPEPRDLGVHWTSLHEVESDEDPCALEPIRDPRFLHKMDQKLFLKTGLPFLRQSDVNDQKIDAVLSWNALMAFSVSEKEKQFSFWLDEIEKAQALRNIVFKIATPFFEGEGQYSDLCRKQMKQRFAEWSVPRD